jgi:hypothetical protein
MENLKNQESELREKKLSEIVKTHKKYNSYITILSVLATIIGLTFTIISLLKVKEEQTVTVDALKNKTVYIDSLYLQKKKQDSICRFTLDFFYAEKSDSVINKYYSPILEVYYQRKNVPIEYILKNKRRFINSYPKSKFDFKKSGINVKILSNDIAEVTANGLFYPDSTENPTEIFYKLKINLRTNKIYYIENFAPNYTLKRNS